MDCLAWIFIPKTSQPKNPMVPKLYIQNFPIQINSNGLGNRHKIGYQITRTYIIVHQNQALKSHTCLEIFSLFRITTYSIKQIIICKGTEVIKTNTKQTANLTPLTKTVMLAYSQLTTNKMEFYFLHQRNLPLDEEAPNDVKRKFKHYVGDNIRQLRL